MQYIGGAIFIIALLVLYLKNNEKATTIENLKEALTKENKDKEFYKSLWEKQEAREKARKYKDINDKKP